MHERILPCDHELSWEYVFFIFNAAQRVGRVSTRYSPTESGAKPHLRPCLCSFKVLNLLPELPIRETVVKLCFSNVLICFLKP